MKHDPPSAAPVSPGEAPAVELVPQAHGGALRRGNPGNKGHPPSWVRTELRNGLVQAVPKLKRAMKSGKDPRTGELLSYRDWLDTCKAVAAISVPMQMGAPEGTAFLIAVRGAQDEQIEEPTGPPVLRVAGSDPTR